MYQLTLPFGSNRTVCVVALASGNPACTVTQPGSSCPFGALTALSCAGTLQSLLTSRTSCTDIPQESPLGLSRYLCNGPSVLLDGLGTPSNEAPKPLLRLLFPIFCRCSIGDAWYDGPTFTLFIGG